MDVLTGGQRGPAGANGNSASKLSSGADGALVFVFDGVATVLGLVPSGGKYTLTRDISPSSITGSAAVEIDVAGFAIFCKGAITGPTVGTFKIHSNGANASGSTAGTAVADGTISGRAAGGTGGAPGSGVGGGSGTRGPVPRDFASGGVNATAGNSPGTNGGIGQGGSGGSTTGGNGAESGANTLVNASNGTENFMPTAIRPTQRTNGAIIQTGTGGGGGGGGFAGGAGGGGGASGGWVVVTCQKFVNNVAIEAKGGNGGNAGAGSTTHGACGGGGGPGGCVTLVIDEGTMPTPVVTGGSGGTGGAGSTAAGTTGGNGGSGKTYLFGP